ncbi:MAG TPA: glyoxylate carboligase [Ktedonobacteraceae bacterium]|nr:glyoxylate carboligase [Ktedonobacteraceae bacterium]
MSKMNPMDVVVKILEDEGVEYVFGVPGAAILPLYQSLSKSERIKNISVRHEEGGTHAADGYARATGKVGISIGTSGPAGTNMITGLYTCLADSIPIICITGQAPSTVLHREAFQAVEIAEIARPVTKWSVQVKETAQLPWVFREAFRIAQSGRPGPVLIDLPINVQKGLDLEYDPNLDSSLPVEKPGPNMNAIRRAIEMIMAAERPMLLAGGGIIIADASDELMALAEYLQIPVTPTLMGKGAIPEDHLLYAGIVGIQTSQRYANQLFLESDLIVAIGARFADRHTGNLEVYRGNRKFIQIDISPFQIGRVFPPDLGIVSDAKLALQAMRQVAQQFTSARETSTWVERVRHLRYTLWRKTDFENTPIKPQRVYQEMNEVFGRDALIVTAIGLYQIWSGQFQRTYQPRHYFCCGQAGPLGWEVPACIGVKLARPDKLVVGVVGDYSFEFLLEEVAVAVQYKVPFVLVMVNNGYMGLIRQSELPYQMNFAVDLSYDRSSSETYGMDHVAIMEAMGATGRHVTRPEEIKPALEWAIRVSGERRVPVLVEVIVERETNAAMGTAINNVVEFEELTEGGKVPSFHHIAEAIPVTD